MQEDFSAAQFEAGAEGQQRGFGGDWIGGKACLLVAFCVLQHFGHGVFADEGFGLEAADGVRERGAQFAEVGLEAIGSAVLAGGVAQEQGDGNLGGGVTGGVEALPADGVALPADAPLGVGEAEDAGDDGGRDFHDRLTVALVVVFLQLATWWWTTLRWERLYMEAQEWFEREREALLKLLRKERNRVK